MRRIGGGSVRRYNSVGMNLDEFWIKNGDGMRRRKKPSPLKSLVRGICGFVLFNLIFFILTSPFVVIYGPFKNVRTAVVEAVATSMHHNLLTYFMSRDQVNRIIASAQNIAGKREGKPVSYRFSNSHDTEIKLTRIQGARFKGYLLEIKDPTRVMVGVAESLGERGQTTSEIAKQCGAVAAINAGGFVDPRGTGNGGLPYGVVIHNGCFLFGGDLKGKVDLVGFDYRGNLIVGRYTVKEMHLMGIREGISFGPPLILNGKKQITKGDGGWGIAPRTAIGQKRDGSVLMLVIDGRQPEYSLGATLLDVQNILYDNGAYVAANLDGGSSTTMYYNGKVINKPCDLLGERCVPTALVVM